MADPKGYYRILGIAETASDREIKAAFRTLSLRYHPDRIRDPVSKSYSNEKMKEINEAYRVLSDSVKRKEYDNLPNTVNREYQSYYPPQNYDNTNTSSNTGGIVGSIFGLFIVLFTIGHLAASYVLNHNYPDEIHVPEADLTKNNDIVTNTYNITL